MANYEAFFLDPEEIRTGASVTADRTKQGGYHDIVEETMYLIRQRSRGFQQTVNAGIIEAPPVQFIVDTALEILTQPSVEARLPLEVWRRGAIVLGLSRRVGAAKENVFLYADMFERYGGIPNFLIDVMTDTERHESLAGNVFREATFAVGGALKFLRGHDVTESHSDIIKASIALPKKIGACFGPRMTEMYGKLGDPYVLPGHLRLHTNKKRGMSIGFSKAASLILDQLQLIAPERSKEKTKGCPAMYMPSPINNNQTIFIDAWERFVDFLTPPGATTDALPGSAAPYVITSNS